MPKNSDFRLPRGHRFRPKLDFTVMAPNPVGTPYCPSWSHWGPIGSKTWVKTIKNYHAPRFEVSAKIWLYGCGVKSRWGPPSVHLGANGVPSGPKNVSKPKTITMPQNSNFRLPRGHRFRPKFDFTVKVPNHGGGPLGSILGPMGSHWV